MAVTREVYEAVIKASTSGAVNELKAWETQVTKSNTQFDKFSKKIGVSSSSLKAGLAGMVSGLTVGALVDGVQQVADAYVTAADGANLLSKATNATVEDASRFNAVASKMGLGMNDLVEIFADFQQAAGKGADDMAKLGVSMSRNAAGQTDWVATATDFLTAVQGIGDATERNRLLFKFFGEEGAKQLMALVSSGRSVSEALAAVSAGQVISDEDVRAANDYKQAMAELKASADAAAISLGRKVVPALAEVAKKFELLADLGSHLPDKVFDVGGLAGMVLKAFGDTAKAVDDYGTAIAPTITAQESLNQMLAAGIPDIQAFRGAVADAAQAQASQEASTRATTDAINAYRAATDLAWQATLNLADAEDAVGDAHQALVNGIAAVGDARARAAQADARAGAGASQAERDRVRSQIADAEKDLKAARRRVSDARKDVRSAFTVGELADARARLRAAQDAVDAAEKRKSSATAHGPSAEDRASARQSAEQARKDARAAEDQVLSLARAQAAADVALAKSTAELEGRTISLADEHDVYVKSLQESKKLATTKKERDEIQALIDKLKDAQTKAGEGIVIGGIRFKEGTTKEQVQKLRDQINKAWSTDPTLAISAQNAINALEVPVSATGLDVMSTEITTVTKDKNGKDRVAKVNVDLVGDAAAKKALDDLALDRTAKITYSIVPPTTGSSYPFSQPGLRAGGQAMPTSLAVSGGGANGAGVNYSPTIVNNYPKPERASDSIASSLRVARYLSGV